MEKIDRNATDPEAKKAAATVVRKAVLLAEAEALSFFDEYERAAEILKPMIRDEMSQGQEPSA